MKRGPNEEVNKEDGDDEEGHDDDENGEEEIDEDQCGNEQGQKIRKNKNFDLDEVNEID